jgi:hypothetical protein
LAPVTRAIFPEEVSIKDFCFRRSTFALNFIRCDGQLKARRIIFNGRLFISLSLNIFIASERGQAQRLQPAEANDRTACVFARISQLIPQLSHQIARGKPVKLPLFQVHR